MVTPIILEATRITRIIRTTMIIATMIPTTITTMLITAILIKNRTIEQE